MDGLAHEKAILDDYAVLVGVVVTSVVDRFNEVEVLDGSFLLFAFHVLLDEATSVVRGVEEDFERAGRGVFRGGAFNSYFVLTVWFSHVEMYLTTRRNSILILIVNNWVCWILIDWIIIFVHLLYLES